MTVLQILNATTPLLSGLAINDLTIAANKTNLYNFLNLAKNQIALDTLMWVDGETITATTGTNTYTLAVVPIQIIDVWDTNQLMRYKDSSDYYGYYQTSPNQIYVNNPITGINLNVNYFITPPDYDSVADADDNTEVVIPHALINALQYFIAHKAFDVYRSEKETFSSTEYFNKYNASIKRYLASVDSNIPTVYEADMITRQGLV